MKHVVNPHARKAEQILGRAKALLTTADAETRDLTPDEQRSYDQLLEQADGEAKRATNYRTLDQCLEQYRVDAKPKDSRGGPSGKAETRALLVPSMAEYRVGQATTPDADGGYLVPVEIFDQVIDRLRPRSVFLNAGPAVMTMGSTTLSVPKIGTGIVAGWFEENAEIDESKIAFGRVLLTARKLAGIGLASSEWLMDSQNESGRRVVETSLLMEIATALDNAAFNGDGLDGAPVGLVNVPGVVTTPITAALTLDDLAASIARVEAANAVPNAIFLHPSAFASLRTERADGSTGAYQLSQNPANDAPQRVFGVPVYLSTHLGTNVVVADMTRVAFGLRQAVSVFYDPYSRSKFDQVLIRATLRADLAPLHDEAVDVLSGITIDVGESESA